MNSMIYMRPETVGAAIDAVSTPGQAANGQAAAQTMFLGGGTNLVDLMREEVAHPQALVDVTRLPLNTVEETPEGGLRIGAMVRNSAVAGHALVRERYPVLSQAILMGASAQLRNMATTGGNLMQRTRCLYFYDHTARCNKRAAGTGCDAREGFNRINAVLGTSEQCIASHPSDMCVALAALDATVVVRSAQGERRIAFTDFHREPGDTPERDTNLEPGELILAVELPPLEAARHSVYRKVRDRASYAFALVSVAAVLQLEGGTIREVRLAMGGVGTKPWRAFAAEEALRGRPLDEATLQEAAAREMAPAVAFEHNGFKIELARRVLVSTLQQLAQESRR